MMKTQQKIAEALFALIALAALVWVAVLITVTPKEEISRYENRYLAEMPIRDPALMIDGSFFPDLDEFLSDHAAFRTQLFQWETLADLHLIRRPNVNDVVRVGDLLLPYNPPQVAQDPDRLRRHANQRAAELEALQWLVQENGGHFLYVTLPDQMAFFYDEFPAYIANHQGFRPELAAFSEALATHGVPLLDLGAAFAAQQIPRYFYSKVDHHFSFHGAFAAYQIILDTLVEQTGLDIPLLTADDFVFTELPNPFAGSHGRRLWGMAPFDERITIAEPVIPVSFRRWHTVGEVPTTVFDLPETPDEEVSYTLYMGGDIGYTTITTYRPEFPNILVFGDSFTNALESLLYLNFDRMTSLDLRHYPPERLIEIIHASQPDIVLVVRDYSMVLDPSGNGRLAVEAYMQGGPNR